MSEKSTTICDGCEATRHGERTRRNRDGCHWLSFADSNLPEGSQFLGVAIVRGIEMLTAVSASHELGINPGGEVVGHAIPRDLDVPVEYRERLLTKDEAKALDAHFAAQNIGDDDDRTASY